MLVEARRLVVAIAPLDGAFPLRTKARRGLATCAHSDVDARRRPFGAVLGAVRVCALAKQAVQIGRGRVEARVEDDLGGGVGGWVWVGGDTYY